MQQTLINDKTKQRNYSIDLVKVVAFCLVVTVHHFSLTKYYNTPLKGAELFLLTCIRNTAMCCVPLFIVATGYLMSEKKWSKNYYWGTVRTLVTLVIAEIVCSAYDSIVFYEKPFWSQILQMGVSHYSWYIDMYVGLFLVIPFLNLAYHSLNSQKEKRNLVLSFVAITILIPSVFSIFKLGQGWWNVAYPLGYYYIGCYLKEYNINIKGVYCALTALASVIVLSAIHFMVFNNHVMVRALCITSYNSIFVCITSTALFALILKSQNCLNDKKILNTVVLRISRLTLGAYLISYMVDDIVYDIAYHYYDVDGHKLLALPVIVITVIAASLCLSYFINIFVDLIMILINKTAHKKAALLPK